jgi:hypothetical protein
MSQIKSGILAEVVGGALYPSPNLGVIVEVGPYQGEHTLHGAIWRCMAASGSLVSEYGVVAIALDFAADWLKPIPGSETNEQDVFFEKLSA